MIGMAVDMVALRRQTVWRMLLLAVLGGHAAMAYAQTQDAINATQVANINSLETRVEALERADLVSRVRVVESGLGEIQWLVRGMVLAVIGQLVLMVMENRRKQREAE